MRFFDILKNMNIRNMHPDDQRTSIVTLIDNLSDEEWALVLEQVSDKKKAAWLAMSTAAESAPAEEEGPAEEDSWDDGDAEE